MLSEQQSPLVSDNTKPTLKILFFVLLLLITFVAGLFIGYLKYSHVTDNSSFVPDYERGMNESEPSTFSTESERNDPTILFAGSMPNILIKFHGNVYTNPNPQDAPLPVGYIDESKIDWTDAGEVFPEIAEDETLFSFSFNRNNTVGEIVFTTEKYEKSSTTYSLYWYSLADKKGKKIVDSNQLEGNKVLRVSDYEGPGDRVLIYGFSCWDCGGGSRSAYVVSIPSGEVRNLGSIESFDWINIWGEGPIRYQYQSSVTVDCSESGSMPGGTLGSCLRDPKKVPYEYGELPNFSEITETRTNH